MKSAIQQDLFLSERRESQLWYLTLGLLAFFGFVVAASYLIPMPGASQSPEWQRKAYTILLGLFLLTVVFCLYVLHTRVTNGKVKSLLVEMNSMASSSVELDEFLTSIAAKIVGISSATTCQIALLTKSSRTFEIKAAYADGGVDWDPQIGRVYTLQDSSVCRRVVESSQPIVLRQQDISRALADETFREIVTGGLKHIGTVHVIPLVADQVVVGLVILSKAVKFGKWHMATPNMTTNQALINHAAAVIEQARLRKEAVHDPLTNLYNRRHFSDRLREEMARAARDGHILAILLCDLDRFKEINDTHGHQTGDRVLQATARSIKESTRGADLVFRWGGDEIVVLLPKTSRDGATIVANRIIGGIRDVGQAAQLDVGVSIGIALHPEHGGDEDELIRTADRALYIAKNSDRRIHVGEAECRLSRDSIKLVFQPVVDFTTNSIMGYEVLTKDPAGKLSLEEFFGRYRVIGRLNELKQFVLKTQIEMAQEIGMQSTFINVDFDVLNHLEPLSKPDRIDVVLELSELEALHDLDEHLAVVQKWRDHGYRFALNNFGAGFVSFPFVAMLVPEYIKLDRATILQAVSSVKFKGFLRCLIVAVRSYATVGIIAEGVETEAELELMREIGVTLAQGSFFGEPGAIEGMQAAHAFLSDRQSDLLVKSSNRPG